MNRIGARTESEVLAVLSGAGESAVCGNLTGAFTHFADADSPDDGFSKAQFERFSGCAPCCLTAYCACRRQRRLFAVPLGAAGYGAGGHRPLRLRQGYESLDLRPAMRFEPGSPM